MRGSLRWLAQTEADVPEGDYWLGEAERRQAGGMRFAKRRHDWRLGRWTAKLAVCAYTLRKDPVLASLEIRAASDGAPEAFRDGRREDLSISVSHSRNRGFCVVGPRDFAVGCDLEFIEARDERFVEDYFTSEEIAFSKRLPARLQAPAVNLIWSAKETALKILREGLRRDTRSISVRAAFDAPRTSWNLWSARCLNSSRVFYGWWKAEDGYVFTLGADRPTSVPEPLEVCGFI